MTDGRRAQHCWARSAWILPLKQPRSPALLSRCRCQHLYGTARMRVRPLTSGGFESSRWPNTRFGPADLASDEHWSRLLSKLSGDIPHVVAKPGLGLGMSQENGSNSPVSPQFRRLHSRVPDLHISCNQPVSYESGAPTLRSWMLLTPQATKDRGREACTCGVQRECL